MTGVCVGCGVLTPNLEAHHVAGQHNHQTLTVPVCIECHRILSGWQLASGVELHADAARGELDATRALLVGVMDLIRLCAQRHPDHLTVSPELAVHTARAISKVLDATGARDRPGRWLPDPTIAPTTAPPVPLTVDTELARTIELIHLLRALADMAGETATAVQLDGLSRAPEQFHRAVTANLPPTAQLLHQLAGHVLESGQLIVALLQHDDLNPLDDQLIEEAGTWIRTGRTLLQQTLALAPTEQALP
jgi:hypothetical protein